MDIAANPFRGPGLPPSRDFAAGRVAVDPAPALALLARCPAAAETPLHELPGLAAELGIAGVMVKDETARMGLGSFKALGAAHAIARAAVERAGAGAADVDLQQALAGCTYACASAGNHGLSVAAGARLFGARAVIYLADVVPEAFAERLQALDAEVVRAGSDYEASMEAVAVAAEHQGWTLLSDSSWPGYVELPARVMEGYLIMADEIVRALERPPTHILLQAGVGGLAAAATALFRDRWGDDPVIAVVEPAAAPALLDSIRAGAPRAASGPESNMGRLDCKVASHLALGELARGADWFVTVDDEQAAGAVDRLAREGIATTASGAAGLAVLRTGRDTRARLGIGSNSRALVLATEAREDAA